MSSSCVRELNVRLLEREPDIYRKGREKGRKRKLRRRGKKKGRPIARHAIYRILRETVLRTAQALRPAASRAF